MKILPELDVHPLIFGNMSKLLYSSIILILLIIFSGCKPETTSDQEINKLRDRQVQIQEPPDESLDKLKQIRDSLEDERNSLIGQRERKDQQIKSLEQGQQFLADQLKQEEKVTLSSEKSRLEQSIARYKDSIEELKSELAILDTAIDSIETSMGLYQTQKRQANKLLESGISEVDQQIYKLGKQKQQEIKKANLLNKRILITEKKIEAYALERQMYVDKRDELLGIQATEAQLHSIPEQNCRNGQYHQYTEGPETDTQP